MYFLQSEHVFARFREFEYVLIFRVQFPSFEGLLLRFKLFEFVLHRMIVFSGVRAHIGMF